MLNMQRFVKDYKQNHVELSMLFNTKFMNDNAQTTTMMFRDKILFRKGTGDFTAVCNGIPLVCNAGSREEITADYPVGVNEVFNDCDYRELSAAEQQDQVQIVSEEWVVQEATYGYNNMTGTDLTAEMDAVIPAFVNGYEEVAYAVKALVKNGYSKKDMIIALDENFATDLATLDYGCCDMGARLSDPKSTLAKKLGVIQALEVPTEVLSGVIDGTPLTDDTTIKFRVYIRELNSLHVWCKDDLLMENISTDELSRAPRVYGKELLGALSIDSDNSEVHAFYEAPAIP